ncbi:MAG: lipid-A-disaccharide synthase [Opitutae bacterium]|nr:lipid-A-disaccharide synthase [Opitutae bacterium]
MSAHSLSSQTLAAPIGGAVDLLVVSAEHSGDAHAARMVRELRVKKPEVRVCALGGPRLAAAGAQLLRDLTVGSTMGFAVLAKLSYYRALIDEVVRWVGEHRPRAVCFVDSSGLNLRIARGLFERGFSAKAGGPTKTLYYISPQIWASRAGRRFAMAQHLDGVAAIFPFEPAAYADTTLPVEFVGHPFLSADYALPVAFDPAGPVLLLPGSRRALVKRVFPVLLEAFAGAGEGRRAVALYPSEEIRALLATLKAASPVGDRVELRAGGGAPVAGAAVLTASGTMSLECALAGLPGALTYKTDPLTYFLGRLIVKVEFIGIANLLLKEAMYPEFIQGAATPAALGRQLRECLSDAGRIERTRAQAARLRTLLHAPTQGSAAEWVLRQLA